MRRIRLFENFDINEEKIIPTPVEKAIEYEKRKMGDAELEEKARDTEVFNFFTRTYDIAKAWKMIQANPDKYKAPNGSFYTFDPADIADWFAYISDEDNERLNRGETISIKMGVHIKPEHAMSLTDEELDEPGIWVQESPEFSILIDGWHRAFANYKKGKKEMKIWVIKDPKDIKKILD